MIKDLLTDFSKKAKVVPAKIKTHKGVGTKPEINVNGGVRW